MGKLHQRVKDIEYFSDIARLSKKWFDANGGKPNKFVYEVIAPPSTVVTKPTVSPEPAELNEFKAVDQNGHTDQIIYLLNTGYFYDFVIQRGDSDIYWFNLYFDRNDDGSIGELVIYLHFCVHSANRHVQVGFLRPQGGPDIPQYKSPIEACDRQLIFSHTELGRGEFFTSPGRIISIGGNYDGNSPSRYYIFARLYVFPKAWLDYVFT